MKIQERITLKRKIMEIALNEAIRGWQAPEQGLLLCPFCQSDHVSRRMQRKNGMIYDCKNCSQPFSEELMPLCRCVRPGLLAKCQTCFQYQRVRELMKFNIDQLRHLSEVEVNQIMAHPNFCQPDFSLYQFLPQIRLRHYTECSTAATGTTDSLDQAITAVEMAQLSLFEGGEE